jgi:hypothetical protein
LASKVAAQQAPTTQQAGNAGAAGENNGEDFAQPETLFQPRYLYQTSPGSGSVPGTIRTVRTDSAILRSDVTIEAVARSLIHFIIG